MEILLTIAGAGSAGGLLAYGSAANVRLMQVIRSAIGAATVNFTIGFTTLALLMVLGVIGPLSLNQLSQAPWWAFFGGALGATYVTLNTLSIPKLGLTNTTMAVAFGQMLMSLIIDQFGLFGVMSHIVSAPRLLGTGLLLAAVILTQLDAKNNR
ncbi:DMT family transporter [Nostoc sp. FACHB-145]|uniref:DMT family transporter n=1 Tax=Nostoc sp. FACHB-145 TaxID=2692836 RepID=UPI0016820851|nr:DMT family transporter [Nostoc sp. FACHB-145]MBD2472450.1 DMT family transporter [Nostoc sp. FACHB-145]